MSTSYATPKVAQMTRHGMPNNSIPFDSEFTVVDIKSAQGQTALNDEISFNSNTASVPMVLVPTGREGATWFYTSDRNTIRLHLDTEGQIRLYSNTSPGKTRAARTVSARAMMTVMGRELRGRYPIGAIRDNADGSRDLYIDVSDWTNDVKPTTAVLRRQQDYRAKLDEVPQGSFESQWNQQQANTHAARSYQEANLTR